MFYRLIVKSHFYVAWMITSLAFYVQRVFSQSCTADLLCFIFFSSWFYYSLANQNIGFFTNNQTKNYVFLIVCFLLVLSFLFKLNFSLPEWIILSLLSAIGFLYIFTIFSFNLRKVPFFKSFVIAFVISAFIFFHLIHWKNASVHLNYFLFYCSVYFYLLGVAILFDIQDIPFDIEAKMKTFPIYFGIKKTKAIVILCFVVSFVFLCFSSAFLLSIHLFSLSTTLLLTGIFCLFLTEKSPNYFYSFLLESSLALPLLMSFLME